MKISFSFAVRQRKLDFLDHFMVNFIVGYYDTIIKCIHNLFEIIVSMFPKEKGVLQ